MNIAYKISYKFDNEESEENYFSSKYHYPYNFTITQKDKDLECNYKADLLEFFVKSKYLRIAPLYNSYSRNKDFTIEVEVEDSCSITILRDCILSEEIKKIIEYLRFCFMFLNRDDAEDNYIRICDRYSPFCNNIYLHFNYLLIEIESYIFQSDKLRATKHCNNILREFTSEICAPFSNLDKLKIEEAYINLYYKAKKSIDEIVDIIGKMTLLLGFRYEYDYETSFYQYLKIIMETLDEKIKSDEVITTQLSFEANETILEGHFKFNRDNERYLYDYLNELYNIFNIGDKKLCRQNRLGGICAIIYDSKVITNCNTFSECMRLLCGYWKRETPKDCRLNKYQDTKQELLDKHRILNEIPRK